MTRAPIVLGLVLFASPAAAHDRTTSYSHWDIRGRQAHVTLGLAALDVSRFPWATSADAVSKLGSYLVEHLRLFAGAEPCSVTDAPRPLAAPAGRVSYEWAVSCPSDGALVLRSELFAAVAPTHLHFAGVSRDGAALPERVLSAASPTSSLAGPDTGTSLAGYVLLGVEHILTGWDHLAFLVALLLIARSAREVAAIVTGFTVAHSITLALAVLGWVRPERAAVEAVIGLSIALVAAENVWRTSGPSATGAMIVAAGLATVAATGVGRVPGLTLVGMALFVPCYLGLAQRVSRPTTLRWTVAFLFGLVHGFGFASVLSDARLAPDRLVHALLGFNGGVELGQLAVVTVAWPLLRFAIARRPVLIEIGSAAVAGLGAFWFVTRAFG
jgi:hypothetical protein